VATTITTINIIIISFPFSLAGLRQAGFVPHGVLSGLRLALAAGPL